MKNILLLILFTINLSLYSQDKKIEIQEYKYIIDSIYSTNIQDYRTIKIFLPKNYSEKQKYPVIYTLDGEWMFEPTVSESKILMDFDVIPKSIVIGVFHKNRNEDLGINWNSGEFSKSSLNFYNFLNQELIPKINSIYSSSGFNTLVGHSNSATFCAKVLTEKEQPFNGFLALSQNLFGNQLQEYIEFTKTVFNNLIFYFVASGKRDATPRIESGMKLDSLFKINQNVNIKTQHSFYDADHSGIAGKGLNNGISHIFSEYKHYNDWDERLIDSLLNQNVNPLDFINQHSKKLKKIYGIKFEVNSDDISLMRVLAKNDSNLEEIKDYEINHIGKSSDFYASYAQDFEYLKSYDKALEYWEKNLDENRKNKINFFYYRRPIELIHKKMNDPKKAIKFAEKWKGKAPEFSQNFNLKIAEITLESNIKKKVGLKAIREYLKNYNKESDTDLEKARELEKKLKG